MAELREDLMTDSCVVGLSDINASEGVGWAHEWQAYSSLR